MGQGITMQWDKQQIQVDAYGDGIIRICELKNGKQPYSAAVELTVEQQQKVAVAQYQVSEQGASTVFETALLRAEVEPDGTITFYNKKNNEKLTCVSEIQEIKKNTLTEEEKAFIGMEGHESGDEVQAKVNLSLSLDEADCIYGLGDKTGVLNKREYEYEMWNSDIPAPHEDNFKALYKSVPFMIVLKENTVYGVFFDNHGKSAFNLGKEYEDRIEYRAEDGMMDYYVITGENMAEVIGGYTWLTGRVPLPMRWTLGYHQCRWSYKTEAEVRQLAADFRRYEIPCDAIYFDIDYMDGYRVFTWNKDNFTDPDQLITDLKEQGFQAVTIIDPGVKKDEDYYVYREGIEHDYFAIDVNGDVYINAVWPGDSAFPDFGRQEVRDWWGEKHQFLLDKGIMGVWNDMNEPASFNGPLPDDVVFTEEDEITNHKWMHNVYGHNMSKATYQGLRRLSDKRPFVITRACYSGTQKYATVWTGDNNSLWTHLRMAIPQLCNLGMSGYPFAGTDIGGFGSDTTGELLVRWYQVGCFSTLFRNHSAMGTRRQEPWLFGKEKLDIIRKYVELRYELIPYFYDLFHEHLSTGLPVMRPLVLEYEKDINTHNMNDEFMIGSQLLAAPVVEQGATKRMVYLPAGEWVDYWTKEHIAGGQYIIRDAPLDTCPIYVKAGTILPKYPVEAYIGTKEQKKLILEVYAGDGEYEHYQDDGLDFAYEQGAYNLYRFSHTGNGELEEKLLHEGYPKYEEIDIKYIP